ncbi:MAG: class I SAM-dependent methyltransferase [Candidatus Eisenbacteria bacterium]|uniref:Class I SAM-dependent methyltransferase n=1 Tax=Eiseniibacteriota bacterium TaxID=2212470 RepID=A0A937X8V1_UNCEI|nr:class I SAM-dependent methyltransferase [Candidatus Eisenbacteria bacterium]
MQPDRAGLRSLYREVAATYELVNRLLTLGLDARWRQRAAALAAGELARAAAAPAGHDRARCLDVCAGTGEMGAALGDACLRRGLAPPRIVCADLSPAMLAEARRKPQLAGASLAIAAAQSLPFRAGSMDLVLMGFAARNVHTHRAALLAAFGEIHRLLAPGGAFVHLETSQPTCRLWRRLVHLYVAASVRPVGRLVSGSRSGYRYLAHTIPRFYGAGELSALLAEAGFARMRVISLLGGVAAIHVAVKGQARGEAGA